jgi:hypothetical protein
MKARKKMRKYLAKWEYFKHFREERKQVVILLGAGAAITWNGIRSDKIKEKITLDETFKVKDGRTMGQFIFATLDKFYKGKDGYKCKNFETAIAAVEEVLNYILAKTNECKTVENTSFIPSIMKLKMNIYNLLLGEEEEYDEHYKIDYYKTKVRECCYEVLYHYINLIIKEIDKYNNKILVDDVERKELNKNLIQFTKYFLDRNYSIKFYTLNYDSLIPQILSTEFKVYEGMYKTNDGYSRFRYDVNCFRRARLSHFNLHGSIFLHNTLDMRKKNKRYEIVYSLEKQLLSEDNAIGMNGGNPNESLLFSPIISGYNKTQRSFNKPFNLGFNAFINDCNDCRALITVGYSFSDPHINSILSSFTNWNKVRFLNITPCEKFRKTDECTKLDYYVTPIKKNEEDGDENETWYYYQKDRKQVYKEGFDVFLKDKSNWAWLLKKHLKYKK